MLPGIDLGFFPRVITKLFQALKKVGGIKGKMKNVLGFIRLKYNEAIV